MDVGSSLTVQRAHQTASSRLRRGSYLERPGLVPLRQQAEVSALFPGWFEMQVEAEKSKKAGMEQAEDVDKSKFAVMYVCMRSRG